jgi:hypothetical protein
MQASNTAMPGDACSCLFQHLQETAHALACQLWRILHQPTHQATSALSQSCYEIPFCTSNLPVQTFINFLNNCCLPACVQMQDAAAAAPLGAEEAEQEQEAVIGPPPPPPPAAAAGDADSTDADDFQEGESSTAS